MIKNLTNLTEKLRQNKGQHLMSLSGGAMLLRKGMRRPGIIGVVSLALGAFTLYLGIKAYRASQSSSPAIDTKAKRAGASGSKPQTATAPTTAATPEKKPQG